MSAENKVPAIRFKEFSGEWEESNINDVTLFIDGNYGEKYPKGNEFIESGVPFFTSAVIGTSGIFNKKNVKYISEEKNTMLVKAQSLGGDLILTNRGASMGSVAQIPYEYGLVNIGPQLTRIRGTEKADNLFLLSMFRNPFYNQKLLSINAGSAMNFVGLEVLGKFNFIKPKVKEQTKIGNYFQQLDNLITQHQQKHDKLLNLKKALLELMFPKQGAKVPEIRFKGFSGKWEEKVLGENVADIIGGGTPSTQISEYWGGDIDWYSPTEIGGKVYADKSEKRITQKGLEKSSAKILPANKTVLFTSRAGIGDMAILSKDGCTNQGFQSFIVKDNYDTYFVFSSGHLIKEYALKHASGSTFLEISGKQLGKMVIKMPINEEQTKIGSLFKSLDTLLNQHQAQLKKLNNIKQACLEKMFV